MVPLERNDDKTQERGDQSLVGQKSQEPRSRKEIWGIRHSGREELERVIELIHTKRPQNIGLEMTPQLLNEPLPAGEALAISGLYSLRYIAEHFSDQLPAIPLENTLLHEYFVAIDNYRKIIQNGKSPEKARKMIQERSLSISDDAEAYLNSLQPYWRIHNLQTTAASLTLSVGIAVLYRTLDDLAAAWETSNKAREWHMQGVILKFEPEIVIVGRAHGARLAKSLPDYQYVDFYPHEPIPDFWELMK